MNNGYYYTRSVDNRAWWPIKTCKNITTTRNFLFIGKNRLLYKNVHVVNVTKKKKNPPESPEAFKYKLQKPSARRKNALKSEIIYSYLYTAPRAVCLKDCGVRFNTFVLKKKKKKNVCPRSGPPKLAYSSTRSFGAEKNNFGNK